MNSLRITRLSLLLSLLFVTVTAIVAGIDFMIYSDGLLFKLPPAMLQYTPFNSFFIPGLISLLMVGGSSLAALLLLRDQSLYALPASLTAGIILVVWVSLASFVYKDISWIEIFYWAAGLQIIVVTLYIQKKYDDLCSRG